MFLIRYAFPFLAIFVSIASGFSHQNLPKPSTERAAFSFQNMKAPKLNDALASAMMVLLLTSANPSPSFASNAAAQISLNSVPPATVKLDIADVPVVGNLISGTYAKVSEGKALKGTPSVTISSPKDKVKAIKSAVTEGHVEFDINGLVSTHVNVDIGATEAGVATVRVETPLIPKLPFKNGASGEFCVTPSGKKSDWNKVVNMGNGNPYYYNSKTGETTYDAPAKF